ncbi:unnamed protein product [Clonostachys byssicola]|uniref:Major facilitator superfamily (MFS) profile domain-containing protein n=1 Tax=Clonostachys byssicola TaxID=160290 RepID=A0A9N9UMH9_9HYPO|nr:unnamed protein product [Clonostachys byssicola]
MKDSQSSAYNTLVVLFVAIGSITYGYCSSIIGTTLGQPSFVEYFALQPSDRTDALVGAINGLFQAGGVFGTLSTTLLADRLGRRKTILAGAMAAVLGSALQTGSVHIAMFMVARLITGFGIGNLVIIVPLWQSEVAPPASRGFLVGMHGVFILCGYSLASWMGVAFSFVKAAGAQWRIPLAIQILPPAILLLGVMTMPESPRWLIQNGMTDRAMQILSKLHETSDGGGQAGYAQREYDQIQQRLEQDKLLPRSWAAIFKIRSYRMRAIVGFLTMFCGQCTATQIINNYGPSLYASMGFDSTRQLLITAGWISVGILSNFASALLLDRVGRVKLMVIGFAGCAIALGLEGVMLALYQGTSNQAGIGAAVFFLFLHIVFYGGCIDATTYVYVTEIWPMHIRSKGSALATTGLFLSSLILQTVSPTAFARIGWRYYMVFTSVCVVSMVGIWLYFPEV